jgi:hypothetical protein
MQDPVEPRRNLRIIGGITIVERIVDQVAVSRIEIKRNCRRRQKIVFEVRNIEKRRMRNAPEKGEQEKQVSLCTPGILSSMQFS